MSRKISPELGLSGRKDEQHGPRARGQHHGVPVLSAHEHLFDVAPLEFVGGRAPRLERVALIPATRVSSMCCGSALAIINPSSEISALASTSGDAL